MDCPEGGFCPGGFRIFAEPGFWQNSPTAGYVIRCSPPPERCTGGQDLGSLCGDGYEGFACADCQAGFFEDLGACHDCGSVGEIVLVFFQNLVLFVILGVSALFVSDRTLSVVTMVLLMTQTLSCNWRSSTR